MDYFDLAKATNRRIKEYMKTTPTDELICRVRGMDLKSDFPFKKAISGGGIHLIGSIRRCSPEFGKNLTFNHKKHAVAYQSCGLKAISVSTEPKFYGGEDSFIPDTKGLVGLPVLQDDFIITPYQIYLAKQLGADAIVLIATIMSQSKLLEFITITHSLGMSAVVVVHSEKSVNFALKAGAKIICAENINPKTRKLNYDEVFRLREYIPKDVIYLVRNIEETNEYIERLQCASVNGVILGDSFMRTRSKEKRLNELFFTDD